MLEGVVLIFGVAVFGILLFLLHQSLDEQHWPFKLFLVLLFAIIIMQVGRVTLSTNETCDVVVANATVTGNTTAYDYTRECFDNGDNTGLTLFKISHWLLRIMGIYVTIYVLQFFLGEWLMDQWKKIFGGRKK